MAWSKTSANGFSVYTEEITLPSSATTEYSSEIDFLAPNPKTTNRNVIVVANASAVSGTNLDISLQGGWVTGTAGGSMVQLVDGFIGDISATGNNIDILDLNAYPSPYYRIAHLSDADESANTITYTIMVKDNDDLDVDDRVGGAANSIGGVGADPS